MSSNTSLQAPGGDGDRILALRSLFGGRPPGARESLARDPWFRRAWAASVFLHAVLFLWVSLAPSEPRYRYFGSGTAVNLVGADEIPGGSARGKSGDRPEALREAARSAAKAKKVIQAEKEKPKPRKKVVKHGHPRPAKKEVVRRIKRAPEKTKKKKADPERLARLRRIRERRERAERWRKRFERRRADRDKQKKPEEVAKKTTGGEKTGEVLADAPARQRPLVGYPGEGGGDGQGGGSLGGGSGGAARTDLERYYGLLAERVRNHWTIPLNLTKVEDLRTVITLDVRRDGEVRNLRIERPSGNRVYDEAALRAVARAANPTMPPAPNTVKEVWLYLGFRFCGRNFCR